MIHIFYLTQERTYSFDTIQHFDSFLGIYCQNEWIAYDEKGFSRVDISYIAKSTLILDFSPHHEFLFQKWDNETRGSSEVNLNDADMFKQLISGIL